MRETSALVITLLSYWAGSALKKRFKLAIINPILISAIVSIIYLIVSGTSYAQYKAGTALLSKLLTPATVCLAIPLYEQYSILKGRKIAVGIGILSGVLASLLCVIGISLLFSLDHGMFITILPKSVTSAIGIEISALNGGNASLSATLIVLAGITGNVIAPFVLRVCKIKDPIAKGVAIGSSSHAIGTARAVEMGEVEGAVSSLAIVIAGLMTVLEVLLVRNLF